MFSAVPAGLATLCVAEQGMNPLPILWPSLRDFGFPALPRNLLPPRVAPLDQSIGIPSFSGLRGELDVSFMKSPRMAQFSGRFGIFLGLNEGAGLRERPGT
jgi:hypothetical protein